MCKAMLEDLKNLRYGDHVCNLGAMIAARLAEMYGKPSYIVNPPVVDELMNEARVTGLPAIVRRSAFHALNQKASALRAAKESGIEYDKGNFIVAHLGGGVSVGAHEHGRVVDVNDALEEGPFSPERAGSLPTRQLVDLCFSGCHTKVEIMRMLVGGGGLTAYFGTTDLKKLEEESKRDKNVREILDAMIYRFSREICACAAALRGNINRVVLTGGLAHSGLVVKGISDRVSFLGPIVVYPGEDEMAALAEGVVRVLDGKEIAYDYE